MLGREKLIEWARNEENDATYFTEKFWFLCPNMFNLEKPRICSEKICKECWEEVLEDRTKLIVWAENVSIEKLELLCPDWVDLDTINDCIGRNLCNACWKLALEKEY